jgi:hypothetical protein
MLRSPATFAVAVAALPIGIGIGACSSSAADGASTDEAYVTPLPPRKGKLPVNTAPDAGEADDDDASAPPTTTNAPGAGSSSSGGGSPPAGPSVECSKTTCTGATPECCAATGTYQCIAKGGTCVGGKTRLRCDDTADCQSGEVCCSISAENATRCVPAAQCKGQFENIAIVCKSDAECPSGKKCTGWLGDPANGQRLDLTCALCF